MLFTHRRDLLSCGRCVRTNAQPTGRTLCGLTLPECRREARYVNAASSVAEPGCVPDNSRRAFSSGPSALFTMKRILIAYDGSPCADAAIADLASAGLPADLEAAIISVADVWLPANTGTPLPDFPAADSPAVRRAREQASLALAEARALAERAAAHLKSLHPGWKVESIACADSPAWGVLNKCVEWRANLVVLGSHGRSTLERLFLGSVSQKVAAEAPCSVRISRPRRSSAHARSRVLVAVDGSGSSAAAVRAVAGRAWPDFSEFRIVTVMDARLETAIMWPESVAAQWVREADTAARDALLRMLEESAKVLSGAGLRVETELLTGEPKNELLAHAEAWEADAIFLGARGLHHGERLALGTMASAIAGRAHCSVEIVRPG